MSDCIDDSNYVAAIEAWQRFFAVHKSQYVTVCLLPFHEMCWDEDQESFEQEAMFLAYRSFDRGLESESFLDHLSDYYYFSSSGEYPEEPESGQRIISNPTLLHINQVKPPSLVHVMSNAVWHLFRYPSSLLDSIAYDVNAMYHLLLSRCVSLDSLPVSFPFENLEKELGWGPVSSDTVSIYPDRADGFFSHYVGLGPTAVNTLDRIAVFHSHLNEMFRFFSSSHENIDCNPLDGIHFHQSSYNARDLSKWIWLRHPMFDSHCHEHPDDFELASKVFFKNHQDYITFLIHLLDEFGYVRIMKNYVAVKKTLDHDINQGSLKLLLMKSKSPHAKHLNLLDYVWTSFAEIHHSEYQRITNQMTGAFKNALFQLQSNKVEINTPRVVEYSNTYSW